MEMEIIRLLIFYATLWMYKALCLVFNIRFDPKHLIRFVIGVYKRLSVVQTQSQTDPTISGPSPGRTPRTDPNGDGSGPGFRVQSQNVDLMVELARIRIEFSNQYRTLNLVFNLKIPRASG